MPIKFVVVRFIECLRITLNELSYYKRLHYTIYEINASCNIKGMINLMICKGMVKGNVVILEDALPEGSEVEV